MNKVRFHTVFIALGSNIGDRFSFLSQAIDKLQDISKTKNHAYRVEITTTSREPNIRRYAKKVARKAKSREKKLDRYLDSDERVEKPSNSWQMKVDFSDDKHHSQRVAMFDNLSESSRGRATTNFD